MITIVSERDGHYRQRAVIEGHGELFADAPRIVGGDESAPDPHDYFDLSLAACKAITVQMYARRKQWPLEGVFVVLSRDEREELHGVYRLDVALSFHGDLSEVQRERLTEISDRCPIQRLMTTSTVEITTRRE